MERSNRVAQFWNWLPAFRAVAETEHLPSAAQAVHSSTSALSRTVRMLEDELGASLFDRLGRDIKLNASGQSLLQACRQAMRMVDEAVDRLESPTLRGPIHVACPGPLIPAFVLPAVQRMRDQHPQVAIHTTSMEASEVGPAIRRGDLDVALADDIRPDPQLTLTPVAEMTHGVYVGPSHPLARKKRITMKDVARCQFAAPAPDEHNMPRDTWPAHLPRDVGLVVNRMQTAIDACVDGEFAAALPDVVAKRHRLRKLPIDIAGKTTVCMVTRPPLPSPSRADIFGRLVLDFGSAPSISP